MKIVIPGQPIAKARHRISNRGGYSFNYDPQDKEKKQVRKFLGEWLTDIWDDKDRCLEASNLVNTQSYLVLMDFYLEPSTNKRCSGVLWGFDLHNIKPDVDNLLKFYLDCLNEVIFEDDKAVVQLKGQKHFSDNARTEIEIIPVRKTKDDSSVKNILKIIDPSKFTDLCSKVELARRLVEECGEDWANLDMWEHEVLTIEVAKVISELAEVFGSDLLKVKKKEPDFYRRVSCH